MKNLIIKENYVSKLSLMETEIAIKFVKDNFEKNLSKALNLTRVSAPLFVLPSTGLNDNLSGVERPVAFDIKDTTECVEIVQSLAKWKRNALKRYNFDTNTGLYTDMNAIRRDEELDTFHSAYVDQWDWEKIISKENRKMSTLKKTVKKIYDSILKTEKALCVKYPQLNQKLPQDILIVSSRELEERWPNIDPKEREYLICKESKAVFITNIGGKLKNGKPHDMRAADYDDWKLNGDLMVYYDALDYALELSSMGIRVDEVSIVKQLKAKDELSKLDNPYVKDVINCNLPYTIGGGIGQSRLCMFLLDKVHVGEVQASVWADGDLELLQQHNIFLL